MSLLWYWCKNSLEVSFINKILKIWIPSHFKLKYYVTANLPLLLVSNNNKQLKLLPINNFQINLAYEWRVAAGLAGQGAAINENNW